MNASDITYNYDSRGYTMYYKGKPIGGAGIAKSAKGHRSNLTLMRSYAESTKNSLLHGGEPYMQEQIKKIDWEDCEEISE